MARSMVGVQTGLVNWAEREKPIDPDAWRNSNTSLSSQWLQETNIRSPWRWMVKSIPGGTMAPDNWDIARRMECNELMGSGNHNVLPWPLQHRNSPHWSCAFRLEWAYLSMLCIRGDMETTSQAGSILIPPKPSNTLGAMWSTPLPLRVPSTTQPP